MSECERAECERAHVSDQPTVVDLFCGLGGWAEGFLAEGYRVIGFDITRHRYPGREFTVESESGKSMSGKDRHGNTLMNRALESIHGFHRAPFTGVMNEYPGQLVLQDILTLSGAQLAKLPNLAAIVASPPCTEFSYMAMPWSRGKQIAAALREEVPFPEGYTGSRTLEALTALFDACFRIQREASEAAGRYIPMVVENVKGAQPWVGRARASYGSFFLWGDVDSIGGRIVPRGPVKFGMPAVKASSRAPLKGGDRNKDRASGHLWSSSFADTLSTGHKQNGRKYSDPRRNGGKGKHLTSPRENADGIKQEGSGAAGFDNGIAKLSSGGSARKQASAEIAKIPFPLARFFAQVFKP